MDAPPAYAPNSNTPAAGLRIPTTTTSVWPEQQVGPAPFQDLDGSPVYVVSAIFEGGEKGVHPGKINARRGECMIAFGGESEWLCWRPRRY